MRYVRKQPPPQCFAGLAGRATDATSWSELQNPCKAEVREQILCDEQQGLCIYCERGIERLKDGHLEHMRPQSLLGSRFDYANIVVSCNGGDCGAMDGNAYDGLDIDSCGHRKGSDFDQSLFLDPTRLADIAEYFKYDRETGAIKAGSREPARAGYMIHELLRLDNPFLNNSRRNARSGLMRAVVSMRSSRPNSSRSKQAVIVALLRRERPFISFLRCCFPSQEVGVG